MNWQQKDPTDPCANLYHHKCQPDLVALNPTFLLYYLIYYIWWLANHHNLLMGMMSPECFHITKLSLPNWVLVGHAHWLGACTCLWSSSWRHLLWGVKSHLQHWQNHHQEIRANPYLVRVELRVETLSHTHGWSRSFSLIIQEGHLHNTNKPNAPIRVVWWLMLKLSTCQPSGPLINRESMEEKKATKNLIAWII